MPLSKARDRERKRQSGLEKLIVRPVVQPKVDNREPTMADYGIQSIDADGNPVYGMK